jgi:hypothetical protein
MEEMNRFLKIMERLGVKQLDEVPTVAETFGLDCHDLNLDNVFVDEKDNTKIVSHLDGSHFFFCASTNKCHDIDLYH